MSTLETTTHRSGPITTRKRKAVTGLGGECPTGGGEFSVALQKPYRAEIEIEGVCPILFHAWNVESIEEKSEAAKGSEIKKRDDVESYVYRDTLEQICIPGDYLRGSIVNAAKFSQDPRSPRKSAMDLFKAAIVSLTPLAPILARHPGEDASVKPSSVKDWQYLDRRRVVVQRSGITRSRPAFMEGWKAQFILLVTLPEYVQQEMLNQMVSTAGRLVGLADYRPTYGRFSVTSFRVLED